MQNEINRTKQNVTFCSVFSQLIITNYWTHFSMCSFVPLHMLYIIMQCRGRRGQLKPRITYAKSSFYCWLTSVPTVGFINIYFALQFLFPSFPLLSSLLFSSSSSSPSNPLPPTFHPHSPLLGAIPPDSRQNLTPQPILVLSSCLNLQSSGIKFRPPLPSCFVISFLLKTFWSYYWVLNYTNI